MHGGQGRSQQVDTTPDLTTSATSVSASLPLRNRQAVWDGCWIAGVSKKRDVCQFSMRQAQIGDSLTKRFRSNRHDGRTSRPLRKRFRLAGRTRQEPSDADDQSAVGCRADTCFAHERRPMPSSTANASRVLATFGSFDGTDVSLILLDVSGR